MNMSHKLKDLKELNKKEELLALIVYFQRTHSMNLTLDIKHQHQRRRDLRELRDQKVKEQEEVDLKEVIEYRESSTK
jgi:hypothetical protein